MFVSQSSVSTLKQNKITYITSTVPHKTIADITERVFDMPVSWDHCGGKFFVIVLFQEKERKREKSTHGSMDERTPTV